jgi:ribosome biogenesis GTPase
VEGDGGQIAKCVCRRNIGDPVCGDLVVWQSTGADSGVITALLPRSTLLSRPDAVGHDKPLAANLTRILIVAAARPAYSTYLIDQYLVAAELIGVEALLLVNKIDLLAGAQRDAYLEGLGRYPRIGYTLLPVTTRAEDGLSALLPHLAGQTAILVGQSGVGKSSLVKSLLPALDLQIGRLSRATGLGRHTTSATTCYQLPNGGHLIDSPGVRSFRLGPVGRAELERGFREFAPYLGRCRFSNCSHRHEPECAVLGAVASGAIAPERLENFRHLAGGET